jgi:fatty-acyl-CoA synthase
MRAPFSRTLFELLNEQATQRPNALAVISSGVETSYDTLAGRARQTAGVLRDLGVKRGERVGVLINNRLEWLEVAFGAWLLGATLAPFSTWSTRAELEFLLDDSGASVLVCMPRFGREDYAAMMRDQAPERFPALRHVMMLDGGDGFADYATARDAAPPLEVMAPGDGASAADPAIILYTSGSTSRPKAIALPHYLLIENGFNIGERQGLTPEDRVLLSPPLFWAYGGINALPASVTHGATLVLQGRFDAGEAIALIELHRCTSIYTLPGMTEAIINHLTFRRERTASLRRGMTIGSPQDVVRASVELGATDVCNVYGASETGGNCCVTWHHMPLEQRSHCQGPPLPGVEMRIIDEVSGAVLGPGLPGQVEVRGPYVMRGYIGNSAAHNAASFTADGWFRSGDIGLLDEAGCFVFQGRSTEMIKRAGINVSPAEVEEVLLQHPSVAQAGVVGVAGAKGETIIAFIVALGVAPGVDELTAHCRRLASSYKVPDRFEFLDAMPVTVTGKLMRKDLKSAAAALVAGEA